MALAPRDVPLTRDDLYEWLQEYRGVKPRPGIKAFLAIKLNHLGLPDLMVSTPEHEDLRDETPLLEMILSDLPSYGKDF